MTDKPTPKPGASQTPPLPWQDRVRAEHAVLKDRLDRLNKFNLSPGYDKLDDNVCGLLFDQAAAMTKLERVLAERIKLFDPPGPPPPFHWALDDIVRRTRGDGTVSLDTMVLMLLGVIHEFVRRPDVREKAAKAVADLTPEVPNAGIDADVNAFVVDAVITAVMEGN